MIVEITRKRFNYRYNNYVQFQSVKSSSLYWNGIELEISNLENQSQKSILVVYNGGKIAVNKNFISCKKSIIIKGPVLLIIKY